MRLLQTYQGAGLRAPQVPSSSASCKLETSTLKSMMLMIKGGGLRMLESHMHTKGAKLEKRFDYMTEFERHTTVTYTPPTSRVLECFKKALIFL